VEFHLGRGATRAARLVEHRLAVEPQPVYHGWVTLSATMLGFAIGTGLGVLLAVGIVYNRAMDASVMPWAIASQTIPIIALAPMIIVVLNSVGITGLIPKAIIAAYLSFFPVVVGMVKGLRAPDAMQLDQMKTWNASGLQGFLKLRLPSSMPYFFASMKIGIAAALVGTIVGELPTSRAGWACGSSRAAITGRPCRSGRRSSARRSWRRRWWASSAPSSARP
jgi:ABC-type nitrate/sulfonate/bicarbonate transport system permease component